MRTYLLEKSRVVFQVGKIKLKTVSIGGAAEVLSPFLPLLLPQGKCSVEFLMARLTSTCLIF